MKRIMGPKTQSRSKRVTEALRQHRHFLSDMIATGQHAGESSKVCLHDNRMLVDSFSEP